jgi:hypothetical protein
MKTLSFVISDAAHKMLEEIQKIKGFTNKPDAVEWLIREIHGQLKGGT